jgi:hypothetical protein
MKAFWYTFIWFGSPSQLARFRPLASISPRSGRVLWLIGIVVLYLLGVAHARLLSSRRSGGL